MQKGTERERERLLFFPPFSWKGWRGNRVRGFSAQSGAVCMCESVAPSLCPPCGLLFFACLSSSQFSVQWHDYLPSRKERERRRLRCNLPALNPTAVSPFFLAKPLCTWCVCIRTVLRSAIASTAVVCKCVRIKESPFPYNNRYSSSLPLFAKSGGPVIGG